MDQGLITIRISKRELVHGSGLLIIQINCLTYGALVGVTRMGDDGFVLLMLFLIKTWNNTGCLSLWCLVLLSHLAVYVTALICGKGLVFLVRNLRCGRWSITIWAMSLALGSSIGNVYGKLCLRRWNVKGIFWKQEWIPECQYKEFSNVLAIKCDLCVMFNLFQNLYI